MRHIKNEAYLFASKQITVVFCDAQDITSRCYAFDQPRGEAYCYLMADGKPQPTDGGGHQNETLRGAITFTTGSGAWHRGPANISGHIGERKPIAKVSAPEET